MFGTFENMSGIARIKVVGVGGAGCNAVNRMIEAGIQSASYVAVNTDKQILLLSKAENKVQIGAALTKGLGAGAEPDVGRMAAEESKEVLTEAIKDTDLLFIAAGMGGGTGTGAAPVIAKIAKDMKILTIAVVTAPFFFEGKKRVDNMLKGIENLKKYVDSLIIIPNDKITQVVPKGTPMVEALRIADEILKQGIRSIADLIVNPALINLDFADVRTILKDQGLAHMGVGVAKGENRIVDAVRFAVNSPLLDTTIEGAKGVILNILGGNDLTMDEVQMAATLVQSVVDYSANIIFGAGIDPNINDEVEVTVIATGFPAVDPATSAKEGNSKNTANKSLEHARNNFTRAPQPLQMNIPQNTTNVSILNNAQQPSQSTMTQSQRNIFPYQTTGQASTQAQTPQQTMLNTTLTNRSMPQNMTRPQTIQQQPLQSMQPMQQNPYANPTLNPSVHPSPMQNVQVRQSIQQPPVQQNTTVDENENLPAFVRRMLRK